MRTRSRIESHTSQDLKMRVDSPPTVTQSAVADSFYPLGSRPFESLSHRTGAAAISAPVHHRALPHPESSDRALPGFVGFDMCGAGGSVEGPLSRSRAAVAQSTIVTRSQNAVSFHPLGSRPFESLFHTTGAASTTAPVALRPDADNSKDLSRAIEGTNTSNQGGADSAGLGRRLESPSTMIRGLPVGSSHPWRAVPLITLTLELAGAGLTTAPVFTQNALGSEEWD